MNKDAVKREAVLNTLDTMDKALDENRTVEAYKELLKECYEVLPSATTKPTECEDAIDRQILRARFNHLDEVYEGMSEDEKHEAYIYGQIIRAIDDAPPVTPKPRTGKWIRHTRVENVYDIAGVKTWGIKHQCDQCTFTTIAIEGFGYYDYCPHCGCRMEGESE